MRFLKTSLFLFIVFSAICFAFSASGFALKISGEDYKMLSKISRNSFQFFLDFTDSSTGLTRDSSQPGSPASIAATGFYLAGLGIAKENGWLSHSEAYKRARQTLHTALKRAEHKNGFFYHFLNPKTARRAWASEASSIDTALFIAGALYVGQVFKDTEIERLANQIYKRVDWEWMTNNRYMISHGWKPERGFLPHYWDMYSEHLILQALSLGASRNPTSTEVWKEWRRTKDNYEGKEIVYAFSGSLFTYQYSHAFIDFRSLNDDGINYFTNSINASLANKEFSLAGSDQYPGYKTSWGLTACLGPAGYVAYGAPPCGNKCRSDGTIAPSGAIGSLPFTPQESLDATRNMWQMKDKIFTRYGFTDSYNLGKKWFSKEYIAIDQGITVLMIENFIDGKIWKKFMTLPAIQRWAEKGDLLPQVA